ncbi:hypothetical protein ACQY1Q_12800 [Tenacibaculum sp. TC6]
MCFVGNITPEFYGVNDAIKRLNSLVESRKTPSAGSGDTSNTTGA